MKLDVNFSEIECNFNIDFGEITIVHTGGEVYIGSYKVDPKVEPQVLPTKDKLLVEDLTINKIPMASVLNSKNGYTITIG